jgi:DNA-binding transcriptional regulator YiaG
MSTTEPITPDEIRAIRRHLGITQEQLAEQMDVSIDAVRGWEQGRFTPRGPAQILLRQFEQRDGKSKSS